MRDATPEIERRGGSLVIVGNGRPDQALRFAEDVGLVGSVYTDPGRVVYRVLGLKHRRADAFTLGALKNTWRAYKSGFRQTSVQGDPWQQGGVFVVDSSGRVKYGYASETTGDHAPIAEILDAVGR